MKKKQAKITEEDFSAWRDNSITEAVFAHLKEMESACERRWVGYLRGGTPLEPAALQILQAEIKAKLEFIEDMLDLKLEDIQSDEDILSNNTARELVNADANRRDLVKGY